MNDSSAPTVLTVLTDEQRERILQAFARLGADLAADLAAGFAAIGPAVQALGQHVTRVHAALQDGGPEE